MYNKRFNIKYVFLGTHQNVTFYKKNPKIQKSIKSHKRIKIHYLGKQIKFYYYNKSQKYIKNLLKIEKYKTRFFNNCLTIF